MSDRESDSSDVNSSESGSNYSHSSDSASNESAASDSAGPAERSETRGESPVDRGRALLKRVRTEPRPHAVAVIVAVVLGLGLSWLHWFGLVVGGALVSFVAPSLRRGVLGAVAFGAAVLVAFALTVGSSTWVVLEMTPVVYLVVASAFGLPVLGSLVRGVV